MCDETKLKCAVIKVVLKLKVRQTSPVSCEHSCLLLYYKFLFINYTVTCYIISMSFSEHNKLDFDKIYTSC